MPMNSDNKAYTFAILMTAMEEYKAGRPVTMKCLKCGEILEVHYDTVTRTWVVKCPSKHFVYYASNSFLTHDKF